MGETILGTGLDLVECERIRQSVEKFGERFLERIFLPGEVAYASHQKYPHRHLAARFAAKEAVSKAFGTGIGERLGWHDMEVSRRENGEPYLQLHANGEKLLRERGAGRVMISLTHTEHYAAATAILISQ
ncbi:MAG: holo-ACP synthase [Verrucomicrobiales bacterium]|jgi:holo-[acyl-carrier protein] synthase|nr:holo-ACP synthase [Verrucomicrobiales bacterium]